jgi:hypothetical protein|tara:strand:- start:7066 stop:9027 length:1962 start_codon:yes stop_codon:yes gene_type:complete
MDPITQQVVLATAGAAGAGDPTYVDDVFSTSLIEGNNSTQTINNGIDLSGEGGLVWIKNRTSSGYNHTLYDTERSGTLFSDATNAASDYSSEISSFNNNGFSLVNGSTSTYNNKSGQNYVSWTFRKAPGFFDVVTYTGNGTAGRTVSHSLGSAPGMIIVKKYSAGGNNWAVYHRGEGNGYQFALNQATNRTATDFWNDTHPTSAEFTLGNETEVNATGATYVAYLFAHDDQSFGTDSDESIIKCGVYSGSGSSGNVINVGFEPQWLMIKKATDSGSARSWWIFDAIRGMPVGSGGKQLQANTNAIEQSFNFIDPHSNGFTLTNTDDNTNTQFTNYIYVAIRRPHKPPAAGTDVFKMQATSSNPTSLTSLNAYSDLVLTRKTGKSNTVYNSAFVDRLRGNKKILTSSETRVETDFSGSNPDLELVGLEYPIQRIDNASMIFHSFKRAPGFFDIVAYDGTGSTTAHKHNLGVTPELFIVKNRAHPLNYTFLGWFVYNSADGPTKSMALQGTDASDTTNAWASTSPTSTHFTTGSGAALNSSGATYVAYLFASLDGISKVGTYTGTGSTINVDCGFTAGARFVMIKRRDSTGDWYVWDTTRGIVSGNDPYFQFNSNAAQVTNTDYIDPLNAGFTVTASGQGDINANGGTYLFLAIA